MSANFWNERYETSTFIYGTKPNDFVAAVAHRIPAGPTLCLAEGEGRNAVYLAERGHATTAVDLSTKGLAKAQALASLRGVSITTQAVDLAAYTITPNAWSGIIATWAHMPPALRKVVFSQVVKGLVPGGVFILEAYTPAQLTFKTGGPKDEALCMSLSDLKEELYGLKFLVGHECQREVFEGTHHTGMGAVVQVLAIKPAS